MSNQLAGLPTSETCCDGPKHINPSITERLTGRKNRLIHELAQVEAALNALNDHPEVQKVMDLVAKINY